MRQSYDDVSGGVQVPPYPPQPADLDPLSDVARRVNSLPAFGIPPSPDLITTAALLQAQAQAQAAAATLGLYPTDGGMNGGMNGGLNPGPMADPLSNLVSQNTMLQAALLQAELNRAMVLGLSLSAATPSGGSQTSQQSGGSRHHLFKTELCRSHEDTGICRYGNKCQVRARISMNEIRAFQSWFTVLCKRAQNSLWCSESGTYLIHRRTFLLLPHSSPTVPTS